MTFNALVLLIFIINEISTISNNDSLSLCLNSTDVDYENYTSAVTENCGCKEGGLCIRKCCQNGFFHYHKEELESGLYVSMCIKNNMTSDFSVPIYDGTVNVFNTTQDFKVGMLTCNNTGYQYFKMSNEYYVQKNSSLHYAYYDIMYDNDRYCIDDDGLTAYLCFTQQPAEVPPVDETEILIHVIAKLISVPFLLATGVVYALLPERNLHRNALMHHVFSLIPGNILLATGQYEVIEHDGLCLSLGLFILFFMVASFFWMNVICIDIWLAFSGLRGFYVKEKLKTRIYIVASMYAWGLPALNVLIVYLLNTYGNKHAVYYPGVGDESCYLNDVAAIIYYFGPIFILIVINLGLFVMTAVSIQKAKKECNIVQDSETRHSKKEEDKFKLYWKLLFVMGLNPVVNTHIIQLIGWTSDKHIQHNITLYIWYFKDFSHATYGLVIFLVFVCQKKIWKTLKERLHCIFESINTNSNKTSATTSSCTPSSEGGPTALRLRGLQNPQADVP